jgi:hypothetical protein
MSALDKRVKSMTGYNLTPPINNKSSGTIGLSIMTAIGAFGGFPAAPKQFNDLVKDELVQYAMLWILIYQGGGSQDPKLTTMVTVLVYAVMQMIK